MLDEFGAEIEHADSRLDATMKKMAKVLHLSDGKCEWEICTDLMRELETMNFTHLHNFRVLNTL